MVGAQKPQPKILSKWLNALHRTLTYERNRTHLTHFSRKISVRTNYAYMAPTILKLWINSWTMVHDTRQTQQWSHMAKKPATGLIGCRIKSTLESKYQCHPKEMTSRRAINFSCQTNCWGRWNVIRLSLQSYGELGLKDLHHYKMTLSISIPILQYLPETMVHTSKLYK